MWLQSWLDWWRLQPSLYCQTTENYPASVRCCRTVSRDNAVQAETTPSPQKVYIGSEYRIHGQFGFGNWFMMAKWRGSLKTKLKARYSVNYFLAISIIDVNFFFVLRAVKRSLVNKIFFYLIPSIAVTELTKQTNWEQKSEWIIKSYVLLLCNF